MKKLFAILSLLLAMLLISPIAASAKPMTSSSLSITSVNLSIINGIDTEFSHAVDIVITAKTSAGKVPRGANYSLEIYMDNVPVFDNFGILDNHGQVELIFMAPYSGMVSVQVESLTYPGLIWSPQTTPPNAIYYTYP